MSVLSEIERLEGAKNALAASIEGKGVAVPAETKIDGMAALVDQIQTGSGSEEVLTKLFSTQVELDADGTNAGVKSSFSVGKIDVKPGRYKATFTYGTTTVEGYATLSGDNGIISAPFYLFNSVTTNFGVYLSGFSVQIDSSGNCSLYYICDMGAMERIREVTVEVYKVGADDVADDPEPCIWISAVDSAGNLLGGAKFDIYYNGAPVDSIVTESGSAYCYKGVNDVLASGEYIILETEAPAGYTATDQFASINVNTETGDQEYYVTMAHQ